MRNERRTSGSGKATRDRPPKGGTALVAYFHRDDNRQKTMTLRGEEFIRRFLIHVLPGGFTASDTSASSATAIAHGSWRCAGNCSGWCQPQRQRIRRLTTATVSRR